MSDHLLTYWAITGTQNLIYRATDLDVRGVVHQDIKPFLIRVLEAYDVRNHVFKQSSNYLLVILIWSNFSFVESYCARDLHNQITGWSTRCWQEYYRKKQGNYYETIQCLYLHSGQVTFQIFQLLFVRSLNFKALNFISYHIKPVSDDLNYYCRILDIDEDIQQRILEVIGDRS